MPVQVTPYNPVSLSSIAVDRRNFDAQQAQQGITNAQNDRRLQITEKQIDAAAARSGLKADQYRQQLMIDIAGKTGSPESAAQYSQAIGLPIPAEVWSTVPQEVYGSGRPTSVQERADRTAGLTPEQLQQAQLIENDLAPKPGTLQTPRVVTIGGVPHIVNPTTNEAMPVSKNGLEVTADTVGEDKRTIAQEEQTGKNVAGRLNDAVLEGQIAADSTASINQALALLESGVNTDRLSATQLAFMQSLGIEDPEAGELSNLLGKAVLTQLRATFGAAFTAEEGNSLKAIEASFGRNPETNKRLLRNALSIATRVAERGLRAAEESRDTTGAEEIRRALNFQMGGELTREQAGPTQQVSPGGERELMEDADGNQAWVYPDGRIEEI